MPPSSASSARHKYQLMRWTTALVVLVAAGGLVPAVAPPAAGATASQAARATARSVTIGIGRNARITGFSARTYTVVRGGTLRVVNSDSMAHTVTSVGSNGAGTALFDTPVGAHASAPVAGVARLAPGRYPFFCRLHPNMRAVLIITGSGGGQHAHALQFRQRLTFPKTIKKTRSTIAIRYGRVRILPSGRRTQMITYNGTYPGPTIRRKAGRSTTVTVTDRLPARAGRFSLHLHGGHQSARSDGQPSSYLIGPGRSRTYRFPLRAGGHPVPPSFGFYHDHVMGATGRNNWSGLQGMVIVDDGREKALGLPTGRYDRPLLVSDRSLRPDHSLVRVPAASRPGSPSAMPMPMSGPDAPPHDQTVGSLVLVNGRYAPYLPVATHRYRFRLLNGSNFQAYDFALSDGRSFTQVGTGSSLLPRPVRRSHILLGPAQRADVVVDFRGELGKRIVLRSVARRQRPRLGIGTPQVAIMQFRVNRRVADHLRLRRQLEATPRIRVPRRSSATWTFGLRRTTGGRSYWTVNGRAFDPRRVDVRVPLGATRRWTLRNTSTVTHFIHLHEEQWHTVSRDGKRPPAYERGLQDTWRLDPGESVDVAARFTDFTGVFMIHCHMLDHEDDGMMAQFAVVRHRSDHVPRGFFLAATRPLVGGSGMPMPAGHDMSTGTSDTSFNRGQARTPAPSSSALVAAGTAAAVLGGLFLLTLAALRRRRLRSP